MNNDVTLELINAAKDARIGLHLFSLTLEDEGAKAVAQFRLNNLDAAIAKAQSALKENNK